MPRKPISAAAPIVAFAGTTTPRSRAMHRFVLPAANPFIIAMRTGSAADSLRVRLLSMPQARQAIAINIPPISSRTSCPCHDRATAPASMAAAPSRSRRSTFSRNTSHAMPMVASASRLSSNEPEEAVVWLRPSISSSGPAIPPNNTTAASQGISALCNGASAAGTLREARPKCTAARPTPAPRYSNPASNCGSTEWSRTLDKGAEAPNRTAEARANGTPGQR